MTTLLLLLLLAPDPTDCLREADRTFAQRKYREALPLYRRAAEAAKKGESRQVQVEALAQVARCLSLGRKLEEARTWLAKAETVASPEEPLGWSRLLGVRGILEREEGDKRKAKATFVEMYRYCAKRKILNRAIDAVHHIAIVVPKAEQPAWALKGIAAAEELGNKGWLAVLWNNFGTTYEDLGEHEKMLQAYLKARTYHHETGGPFEKLIADWAVGHSYRLLGKLEESRKWLQPTLAQVRKLHENEPGHRSIEWLGWCKKDLGEVRVAEGDRTGGRKLLVEARAHLVEAGIEKWWPEALKKLDATLKSLERS
jgi:tetratricopeptide (TPR) repeat protein